MTALLPLLLALASTAPVDAPRTYLVSIVDLPLKPGQSVERFRFDTWGVGFDAVCRIPPGWSIKAGGAATPDGVLEGEGSHGATWFNQPSPKALNGVVLVTLTGPIQKAAIVSADGEVPATFSGHATLSTDDEDIEIPLSADNIRLVPARRC